MNFQKFRRENLKIWLWFLIGLLVRLIAMPIAMHTDRRFTGDLIQIARVAQSQNVEQFWYPPLLYYTTNLYQKVALASCPSVVNSAASGSIEPTALMSDPAIFCTLFALKFWYLGFDFAIAILLWKLFSLPAHKRMALCLWLFNPIVIYGTYVHGQFDVIPTFFVVLGLYLAKGKQFEWTAFWFGIGACLKIFPLFFLLPAIIVLDKTWRRRLRLLLLGILPYTAIMLPFLGQYRAGFNAYSTMFFKVGYDLGSGAQIYAFFIFYAVLLWYLYQRKANTFEDLWRACFAILLIYYQFSYYDLHYWIWIVPFGILYLVEYPSEATPFYIVIGLFLLVLLIPTPLGRFLAPISPRFFLRLPSLLELLNPYLPMLFLINVVRSMLAGTCFYLSWKLVHGIPATRNRLPEVTTDPTTTS